MDIIFALMLSASPLVAEAQQVLAETTIDPSAVQLGRLREDELAEAIEEATTTLSEAENEVSAQKALLASLQDNIALVHIRGKWLSRDHSALQAEVSKLTARYAGLAQFFDTKALSYQNLTTALNAYHQEQLKTLALKLDVAVAAGCNSSHLFFERANYVLDSGTTDGTFDSLPIEAQNAMRGYVSSLNRTSLTSDESCDGIDHQLTMP